MSNGKYLAKLRSIAAYVAIALPMILTIGIELEARYDIYAVAGGPSDRISGLIVNMGRVCCVVGCHNRLESSFRMKGITFHR
jgi:hypothetical protein